MPVARADTVPVLQDWPADGPRWVQYFGPGSSAPACGLISSVGGAITVLLAPAEGADFPQCEGVQAGLSFRWAGERYYLLRLVQRDTREDRGPTDVLWREARDGLAAVDLPAADEAPRSRPRSLALVAAAWRAQAVAQDDARQGFQPAPRDTVLTDAAFLTVAVDAARGQCRFTLGRPTQEQPEPAVIQPCRQVLATSSVRVGPRTGFVALLQRADGATVPAVFTVGPEGAGPAPELAERLRNSASGGRILPVRDGLKSLLSGR